MALEQERLIQQFNSNAFGAETEETRGVWVIRENTIINLKLSISELSIITKSAQNPEKDIDPRLLLIAIGIQEMGDSYSFQGEISSEEGQKYAKQILEIVRDGLKLKDTEKRNPFEDHKLER